MARVETPNPGSDEAQKRGCTCPVLDNGHGAGHYEGGVLVFWQTAGCPLHQPAFQPTEGSTDDHD